MPRYIGSAYEHFAYQEPWAFKEMLGKIWIRVAPARLNVRWSESLISARQAFARRRAHRSVRCAGFSLTSSWYGAVASIMKQGAEAATVLPLAFISAETHP